MPITDLKAHCATGGTAVNGWCAIPSPVTAEIMGRAGFDLMTVEMIGTMLAQGFQFASPLTDLRLFAGHLAALRGSDSRIEKSY